MENDDNIDHLHDPEDMLGTTSADNAGREVETELYTKASFIPSLCGNKFSQDAKPHIYFVSNAAMTTHNGIPSIRVLLDQCLGERGEEDVVILCSTTKDASIAKSALDNLGKTSRLYIPYLKGKCSSSDVKKKLLKDLESDRNLVLISDYRSFRGCEAAHTIIFSDHKKPNIMAEMLSRTMAHLDIIVSLKNLSALPAGPIKTAFNTWERRGLVDSTTINFFDEDASFVTITLRDHSKVEKVINVEKPLDGFTFEPLNGNQRNYL